MRGLWGKKVGMTQIFLDDNYQVVPVTAIDLSNWYITNIKTNDNSGYNAVQVGCLKDKFVEQTFSKDWLTDPKKYFNVIREIKSDEISNIEIGQSVDLSLIGQSDIVDVVGTTKGAGFQGVVKRLGFTGGRASHGATFGRFTGSLSYMRSRGRVEKGKGMPGRMGNERCTMQKLKVVKIENEGKLILVKGSVPGKSGSLVFVSKAK